MGTTTVELPPLPDPADAAWAKFDADWYLRTYPQVRGTLIELADETVFAYWRERGQLQGHAPNPFFDEAFFLRGNKAVAEAVRDGSAPSGFAVYCRDRGHHRMPHWLFDEAQYRRLYDDMTDAVLAKAGLVNGYDHFLRHGAREGRIGSVFFDPAVYRANLSEDDAAKARAEGWFISHVTRLHAGIGWDYTTSLYFDPAWYLQKYQAVAALVATKRYLSALHHYLTNDTPTQFDPRPEFSEAFYLHRNPDVAAAVASQRFRNGYEHFVLHGVFERRAPSEAIDLKYYTDTHRQVREDLKRGAARDAFAHYVAIGRGQGLHTLPLPDETFTEGQARTLFRLRAQALVPIFARRKLDFSFTDQPALSVVMVVHDSFALTLQALASLRANFAGAIELILVDSGSIDETPYIERCMRGATLLRFDMDIGPVKGRNAGLQGASADAVLFMDNDVELAPGAIAAALERLNSDPTIGAVGGKVVRAHARLQEAGCIVWRDGATRPYLRDALPTVPEANFVRDVDFCSGLFLMARASLLHELEGFAHDMPPGTYEDADLGMRIAATRHRVAYDPSVVIHRLETDATASATASQADMSRAREMFVQRHAGSLRLRKAQGPMAELFARSTGTGIGTGVEERRILFIEDTVPLRMIGGGFVRSNDLIAAMAASGYHVTVFPLKAHRFDLAAIYAETPDAVEMMHDKTADDLAEFMARRAGYYDVVWVARAHGLDRIRPILAAAVAGGEGRPRILLAPSEIAALRDAARAVLSGEHDPEDAILDDAVRAEFANASICDGIVVVSDAEAGRLRGLGFENVSVIGPARAPAPTPRRFEDRQGMLFVGAITGLDTPNYDSLSWFADEVLPLVQQSLGWETRLTIAGYTEDAGLLDRFRGHARITVREPLADTTSLYDSHRMFVAPTRYAAGLPYKVYEAASFGVPVVASDMLCRQMGWRDGEEVLSAPATDPATFAARIVGLYRDEVLWQRLRDAALARVAAENGPERMVGALRKVLG